VSRIYNGIGLPLQTLRPGEELGLEVTPRCRTRSVLQEQDSDSERVLTVRIPGLMQHGHYQLPVSRSSRRYLPAGQQQRQQQQQQLQQQQQGVVADVGNRFGFRTVAFRSVVQIRNHFGVPVDVYYMTRGGNELAIVGRLAEGQTLNVPPRALYTPTAELFFIPLG